MSGADRRSPECAHTRCSRASGRGLEEECLAATIEGIELDLELGHHGDVLGQLEALVIAHPFKERLVELQMVSLYRCGRQADALAAFHAARARLVEELGIQPGQRLRELYEDVVRHTASLGVEPRPTPPAAHGDPRLPVPPNRTVGRERDLQVIGERLRAGSVRLLTLTGPGGVGKTRLAVEAASIVDPDFVEGAWFVSLAPLKRHQDVSSAIIQSLGITVLAGESATQAIQRFLSAKRLLLVLDNFEHLLDAAPAVGELLEACRSLTVLATSRQPLGLQAEHRFVVPPLALPEAGAVSDASTVTGVAAVTLFSERARSHDADFTLDDRNVDAVAAICRRVDGLPLAIELAAARCALLSPQEIARRLDAALATLAGGARDAPARQRTLRATIDWSHDLLDRGEKASFARFAVFAGGATIDAAEAITGADLDTIDRLVAKSLLARRSQGHGQTRLFMLETVRAYAAERLDAAPDVETIRERHYRHFLAYAQRHGARRALNGADRRRHLARLDAEADNLRAALRWSVARPGAGPALALTAVLVWYWLTRSRYAEGLEWIDRALDLPGADAHPAWLVSTLQGKVWMLWPVGRRHEQRSVVAEAEAVARRSGDPALIAQALATRTDHASITATPEVTATIAHEALEWAAKADDPWEVASVLRARTRGCSSPDELRARVERAAESLQQVGNVYELGDLLLSAAYSALLQGSDDDAHKYAQRATPIVRDLDDRFMWMALTGNRGLAALFTSDYATARTAFREELEIARDLVVRPVACEGFLGLAGLAAVDGDALRAARLQGAAQGHDHDDQQAPIDARVDAAFLRSVRETVPPDEWDRAMHHGATLSFENAIAYALDEAEPGVPAP